MGSLVLAWIAFVRLDSRIKHESFTLDRPDRTHILLLLVIFAPAYLAFVYLIPFQMSTDEIVIMQVAGELTAEPGWDIFSLSTYSEFPAFAFLWESITLCSPSVEWPSGTTRRCLSSSRRSHSHSWVTDFADYL